MKLLWKVIHDMFTSHEFGGEKPAKKKKSEWQGIWDRSSAACANYRCKMFHVFLGTLSSYGTTLPTTRLPS